MAKKCCGAPCTKDSKKLKWPSTPEAPKPHNGDRSEEIKFPKK